MSQTIKSLEDARIERSLIEGYLKAPVTQEKREEYLQRYDELWHYISEWGILRPGENRTPH